MARGAIRRPSAGWCSAVAAVLLLMLSLHGAHGACRLRLGIDAQASSFSLSGRNTLTVGSTRIPAPISPVGEYDTAFVGALFANATGDCPTSYQDWASLLPTLTLTTNGNWTEYQGVELYPAVLTLQTAGSLYEPRDFLVSLESTRVSVNAATGDLLVEGNSKLERGFLLTSTIFTGTRYDDVADGEEYGQQILQGVFTGRGKLSVSGGVANLDLSDFNLTLAVLDTVDFSGTQYDSYTELWALGRMLLTADTTCDVYCGDHGRCVVSAEGVRGCQCECGWTADASGACVAPSGFCKTLGDLDSAIVVRTECDPCECGADAGSDDYQLDFSDGNVTEFGSEGAADVYRPIIAFAPVIALVLLLAAYGITTAAAWPWMYPASVSPSSIDAHVTATKNAAGQHGAAGTDRPVSADAPTSTASSLCAAHATAQHHHIVPRDSSAVGKGAVDGSGNDHSGAHAWHGNGNSADGISGVDAEPSAPPCPVAEATAADGACAAGALHSLDVVVTLPDAEGGNNTPHAEGLRPPLVWNDMCVWVASSTSAAMMSVCCRGQTTSSHRAILSHVSGMACMGEVTGLLGPSGSGKTTLLNALAGLVRSGGRWCVDGRLQLDGVPTDASALSRAVAHVPQFDLLMPGLTVIECLRYAAACRLGRAAMPADAHARVQHVLTELDILHIAGERATGDAGGISGGERKRVSIGMELVGDARLLLLDEPTSGLDSFTASRLLQLLHAVASGDASSGSPRRVVLASLHQPSPSLFDSLDRVVLLARGRVVFAGSPAEAPQAMAALSAPCPPGLPIAEHLLICAGDPEAVGPILRTVAERTETELCDATVSSAAPAATVALTVHDARAPADTSTLASTSGSSGQGGGGRGAARSAGHALNGTRPTPALPGMRSHAVWCGSCCGGLPQGKLSASVDSPVTSGLLLWREGMQLAREPSLLVMHLIGAAAMGLLVGFTYFRADLGSTSGVTGRLGTLFFTLQVAAFPSLSAMDCLFRERAAATREMLRKSYTPGGYMTVKLIVDGLLMRALPSAIYTTLFYWLIGMRADASGFCIALGVIMGFTCSVGALVMCLANFLGSPGRTVLASAVLLLIFALFGGFLVDKNDIHWVLRWICYASPTRWAWEALAVNEIRPLRLTLEVEGIPGLNNYPGGLFLRTLGVDPTMLTQDIAALSAWYAGIALCTILSMYMRLALVARGWTTAE